MTGSGVPVDALALIVETIDASFTGSKTASANVTRTGEEGEGGGWGGGGLVDAA